jgi:hypothetical protein
MIEEFLALELALDVLNNPKMRIPLSFANDFKNLAVFCRSEAK